VLDGAVQANTEQRRAVGFAFLRDEVYPRRTALVSLTDQISAVNEHELNSRILQVTELFAGLRARVAITLFVSLGLGALLATFSTRRILTYEGTAAEHLAEIEEAQLELKELSARLVEVQETERRTISRAKLHDEVGQSLSALLVALSNMSANLPSDAAGSAAPHLSAARGLAESSLRAVRDMALLLRPSMLDDLGLVPALRWQGREVSRRTGMTVSIDAAGVPDELPDAYRTSVYRVVQGALHNCEQHARATEVRVTLRTIGNALVLSVKDDGAGFDANESRGMGLLGMQERVASFRRHVQRGIRRGQRNSDYGEAAVAGRGKRVKKIRILLADDHTVMRSGLKALLERQSDFEVTGEAADGREAVDLTEKLRPEVVVIDVAMPRLNGLDATQQIVSKHAGIAVVVLSMHSDEGYIIRALKAGARGYLLKDSAEADLIAAIRAVHDGKAFFSP